jgi:hypothetical protein
MDKPIPNFKKFGLKSGATRWRRQQQQQQQRHDRLNMSSSKESGASSAGRSSSEESSCRGRGNNGARVSSQQLLGAGEVLKFLWLAAGQMQHPTRHRCTMLPVAYLTEYMHAVCGLSCVLHLPGEVPKFFDNVLAKRAGEAVSLKGMWWDARRDAAMEGIKEKEFKVGGRGSGST